MYQGICYTNILGCLKYNDGRTCNQCQTDIFELKDGSCNVTGNKLVSDDLMNKLYLYNGNLSGDPGAQFG